MSDKTTFNFPFSSFQKRIRIRSNAQRERLLNQHRYTRAGFNRFGQLKSIDADTKKKYFTRENGVEYYYPQGVPRTAQKTSRSKLANVGKYAHELMDRVKQIENSISVHKGAGTKESPFELSEITVYGKRFPGVIIIGNKKRPVSKKTTKNSRQIQSNKNRLMNEAIQNLAGINTEANVEREINNELNRRDSLASRLIVPENSPLNNTSINNFEYHIVSQPDIPINSFPSRGRQRIQDEVDPDDYVSPLFAPQGYEDFYV